MQPTCSKGKGEKPRFLAAEWVPLHLSVPQACEGPRGVSSVFRLPNESIMTTDAERSRSKNFRPCPLAWLAGPSASG